MTDILFLLAALALVAAVMVPVVAEGIHHTRFWRRRTILDAAAAVSTVVVRFETDMKAFAQAVDRATESFRAFAEAFGRPLAPMTSTLSPEHYQWGHDQRQRELERAQTTRELATRIATRNEMRLKAALAELDRWEAKHGPKPEAPDA